MDPLPQANNLNDTVSSCYSALLAFNDNVKAVAHHLNGGAAAKGNGSAKRARTSK